MASELDHRHISYVAAVCREGTLGRAAKQLGVAQPTLSKMILRMEDRLGVTLFDRSGKGMAPTVFAQHLAERSAEIEGFFDKLDSDVRSMALGAMGRLRIGLGTGMAHLFRLRMVQPLLARYPSLRLEIEVLPLDGLYAGLRAGAFEFILANPVHVRSEDDFETVPLVRDRLACFCRPDHPLASAGRVAPIRLIEFPCAFPYMPPAIRRLFPQQLTAAQERNLFAHQIADVLLLREIVKNSDAISYNLASLLVPDLEKGLLAEVRLVEDWPFRASLIATRAAWHSPVVRQAAEIFRASVEGST